MTTVILLTPFSSYFLRLIGRLALLNDLSLFHFQVSYFAFCTVDSYEVFLYIDSH